MTAAKSADKYNRAAFESYGRQQNYHDFEQNEFGDYLNSNTNARWVLWKASRDSIVRPECGLSSPIPDGYAEWKLLGIERRRADRRAPVSARSERSDAVVAVRNDMAHRALLMEKKGDLHGCEELRHWIDRLDEATTAPLSTTQRRDADVCEVCGLFKQNGTVQGDACIGHKVECCMPNESAIDGFCYYAETHGEEHRCMRRCERGSADTTGARE